MIVHFVDVSKMFHPISAARERQREGGRRETGEPLEPQLGGIPRDWFLG